MSAQLHAAGISVAITASPADYQSISASDLAVFGDSTVMLEGRDVRLRVVPLAANWLIAIEGHGDYLYNPAQRRVQVLSSPDDTDCRRAALQGPVLMHALAHESIYVLHASAVLTDDGVVAFTADSGTGKSTVAAAAGDGWQRVADDLLAVTRMGHDTIVAKPHLPQPKLGEACQYPPDSPAALPLRALVELTRGSTPSFSTLDGIAALAIAVRATVGTRAYAPPTLTGHLGFCAELARQASAGRILVGRLELESRPGDAAGAARVALAMLREALAPSRRRSPTGGKATSGGPP